MTYSFWVLRFGFGLAFLDLALQLVVGPYRIPLTNSVSNHPATAVFLLLVCGIAHWGIRSRSRSQPWSKRKLALLLGLIFWTVYLSNFRWRGSGDVVAASLQPFALLREGTLHLDNYYKGFLDEERVAPVYHRNGHVFSKYTSAPGVLLAPFYVIPALCHVPVTDLLIHQLQKIGASFMVALSSVVVFLALSLFIDRRWSVFLTVVYALGTSSLSVSSQAIWQHGPSQLFLSIGLYSVLRTFRQDREKLNPSFWLMLSGFGLAMATWCRYSNVFVLACVGLYLLLFRKTQAIPFLLGTLPPIGLLLGDNYFHTGSILEPGQQRDEAMRFTWEFSQGISGLLFSPSRGIFLYTPWVVLGLWGFCVGVKGLKAFWRFLGLSCLLVLLFYALYVGWPGGWSFGPRYLSDLSPLFILGVVPLADRLNNSPFLRKFFGFCVAWSMTLHAAGAWLSWHWETVPLRPWEPTNHPFVYFFLRFFGRTSARWSETLVVFGVFTALWFYTKKYLARISVNSTKEQKPT